METLPIDLIQRHRAMLADALESFASRSHGLARGWEEIDRIARSCAALGAHGVALIAQSNFPELADHYGSWACKSMLAYYGLRPARAAVEASIKQESFAGDSYPHSLSPLPQSPQTHLNHCAALMVERALLADGHEPNEALRLWLAMAGDSAERNHAASAHACQANPCFNPMEALCLARDSAGLNAFLDPESHAQIARSIICAPGFEPRAEAGLLCWLRAAPGLRGSGLPKLDAALSNCRLDDKLAALLAFPGPWHGQGVDDSFQAAVIHAYPFCDGPAACSAAKGFVERCAGILSSWSLPSNGKRLPPSLHDIASAHAIGWLFSKVSSQDVKASSSPRLQGAWIDLAIAAGQWRHFRELSTSKAIPHSRLLCLPLAFARGMANMHDDGGGHFARFRKAEPALRKAAHLSGSPAAFCSELSAALPETFCPPAFAEDKLAPRLSAMGALAERKAISQGAPSKPAPRSNLKARL